MKEGGMKFKKWKNCFWAFQRFGPAFRCGGEAPPRHRETAPMREVQLKRGDNAASAKIPPKPKSGDNAASATTPPNAKTPPSVSQKDKRMSETTDQVGSTFGLFTSSF